MVVNEGQMVCVELAARNPVLNDSRVLFLGSIKYEALKKVYDTRVKLQQFMEKKDPKFKKFSRLQQVLVLLNECH